MSVHYKFKSSLDFDTITFDGLHISVDDLKKAIVHQKRLGKTADFDLQITNAQTKEEYTDDSSLIPKNTSLVIARVPLARQAKKVWDPTADKAAPVRNTNQNESEQSNADLSRMNGSEEDKINAMMVQSTIDYDPNNYHKIRGAAQTGEVPSHYRCHKCNKTGHWIKNCPLNISIDVVTDLKRNTGIPRSFIDSQNDPASQPPLIVLPMEKKLEIPDDLLCSICKDLFTDAVMIPCCGSSFCDECVRTALLESEDNECPDCSEKGSSPGSLIPNRFLRNSVNSFKNETGYSKPRQAPKLPQAPPPAEVVQEEQPAELPAEQHEIAEPEKGPSTEEIVAPIAEVAPAQESPPKEVEAVETKIDEVKEKLPKLMEKIVSRPDTPHDESDYEDNITVTVPPPHLQSGEAFLDRHLNGRPRHTTDTPPRHHHHIQVHQRVHEDRSATPTVDEKESYAAESHKSHHDDRQIYQQTHHHAAEQYPPQQQQQQQYSQQPIRPYNDGYAQTGYQIPSYDPHRMHRPPYHHRGGGGATGAHYQAPMQHQVRPRHLLPPPPGSVASVFQGVAAKIGSGIIDDPLEAFNRIMREKERRKEEGRRNSPPRRRSRSIDAQRRRSPLNDRRRSPRQRSPETRRGGRVSAERRGAANTAGRSPERRSEERRRKRSNSYDTRQSRSYSRSRSRSIRRQSRSPPLVRKRSRTPPPRRSTRSRSPSFSISRSRSRSMSPARYNKAHLNSRYIRSSPQPRGSPRSRFRDTRRVDRRDDYHNNRDRDDFRDRSPGYNQNYPYRGRGSYRGRGRGGHFRNDRPPLISHHPHPNDQYYQQSQQPAPLQQQQIIPPSGYNDGSQYHLQQQPPNRYAPPMRGHSPIMQPVQQRISGYLPPPEHIITPTPDPIRYETSASFRNPYDVAPPGTTEPPPPGFENAPLERFSRERETWNIKPLETVERHRDEFRHSVENPNVPPYEDTRHLTPELRIDRPNNNADMITRTNRSNSRSAADYQRNTDHRAEKVDKRRRSKTPIYRDGRKDKETSRDDRPRDGKHETSSRKDSSRDRRSHRDAKEVDKEHEREKENKREKEKVKEKEKEKEKRRDSTDDEKRERKAKEKKRKRKEEKAEKALEKKKKKERKEKEKREKELRKEQERARKLLEAKIDQKVEEDEDEEDEAEKTEEDIEDREFERAASQELRSESRHSSTSRLEEPAEQEAIVDSTSPAPPPQQQQHNKSSENDELDDQQLQTPPKIQTELSFNDDYEMEEGECDLNDDEIAKLHSTTPPPTNAAKDDEHSLDLYGDIVDTDLMIDYPNETREKRDDGICLLRSDSILDIHANLDFDQEIEDLEPEVVTKKQSFLQFPEPSKWERDEDILAGDKISGGASDTSPYDEKGSAKVTNEVLKRAENAIFARAINAIRPIEIKKISVERQKLYANEKMHRDNSPVVSLVKGNASPIKEMHTFQITVPVNNNNDNGERSVEIKTEISSERTKTPIRSIKDRLGSKVSDIARSRTKTPPRKAVIENNVRDRRRSRDRKTTRDEAKSSRDDAKSSRDEGKSSRDEGKSSRDEVKSSRDEGKNTRDEGKSSRDAGKSSRDEGKSTRDEKSTRDRDESKTNRDEGKTKDSDRSSRNESNKSSRNQDNSKRSVVEKKTSDRDRREVKIDSRSKDSDRGNDRNNDRSNDRRKNSPTHANRDREREKARELARARERERLKELSKKDSDKSDKTDKTKTDKKTDEKDRKRDRSPSDERKDRKDKKHRKDDKKRKSEERHHHHHHKKEPSNDVTTTSTSAKEEKKDLKKVSSYEKKKSMIDEANFVPDYDEPIDETAAASKKSTDPDGTKESSAATATKTSSDKKRSRSVSESSSSSSDSDSSESSSESEDKKRKKRKHKKTKRSKRASSSESEGSTKKKKSKKKKSKKKKKGKK